MPHLFPSAPSLSRLRQAGACLCLCLVLVVAGCSYSGPGHPYTLPQLHIPQLQWVPALSRIPTDHGIHGGVIHSLTTFQWPGTSTPQVILNLNITLEISGLDGSGQRFLNTDAPCNSSVAVTTDGSWIACVSSPDNDHGYDRLQVAALSPTGVSQVRQIQLSSEPFYSSPIWSPDGRYLAVVLDDIGQGCSVDIYSSPPPHTTFTHAVTLTAAQFSGGYCQVNALVWPSDGQRLFVLGLDNGTDPFLASVSVLPLLQTFASAADGQVVTQEVPSDEIQTFSIEVQSPRVRFLTPEADTLYFTTSGPPEQLMSLNLHTQQVRTLLTFPDDFQVTYEINGLTLTPDGRQLLLAVGGHPCVDCGRYAISDVYAFSLD